MSKKLHFVTFNVPYPPDYGGIIDVFYKLKELKKQGIEVILHQFVYERPAHEELTKYCSKIYSYDRKIGIASFFSWIPFIVVTRKKKELLQNLLEEEAAIFFEGIHTTAFIDHPLLRNRIKMVRAHNIEHKYYFNLARFAPSWSKKLYFFSEAIKLYFYEKKLRHAQYVFPITREDSMYFEKKNLRAAYLPAFHPFENMQTKLGKGEYILHHADFSVDANVKVLLMLIHKVFSKLDYPIKIAGKKPAPFIKTLIDKYKNIELIENPNEEQMTSLLLHSHIIIIPALQVSGLKLKLLASLYLGRFCIVNSTMLTNTELHDYCVVKNTPDEMLEGIHICFKQSFTEKEFDERERYLLKKFNNSLSIEGVVSKIISS